MRVRTVPMMVVLTVCMMTWIPVRADVFYDMRLKAGHDALLAQRWLDAAESLRIACFGFLDSPKILTPCLAQLALAQNGLGRSADVDATLGRIVEVETRFAAYDPNALDPDLRTRFEALLAQHVAKSTLLAIPTLARIADPNAAKAVAPSRTIVSSQVTTTTGSAAVPPATAAPTASSQTSAASPATSPAAVPVRPQTSASPRTAGPRTPAGPAADSIENAKRLLAEGKASDAKPFLVNAVTRDPGRRELRLLLLQAAVLSNDWQTAMQQVPMTQPFADNEAAAMFYASIALYENRRSDEARELMTRALPRLTHSGYVDAYAKRILGR